MKKDKECGKGKMEMKGKDRDEKAEMIAIVLKGISKQDKKKKK